MHNLIRIVCMSLVICTQACSSLDTLSPDTDEDETGGGGSSRPQYIETPPSPPTESDEDTEDFDPCPDVTYILWDGYEVTLDVFCDPQPVFNTGCPGPDSSN